MTFSSLRLDSGIWMVLDGGGPCLYPTDFIVYPAVLAVVRRVHGQIGLLGFVSDSGQCFVQLGLTQSNRVNSVNIQLTRFGFWVKDSQRDSVQALRDKMVRLGLRVNSTRSTRVDSVKLSGSTQLTWSTRSTELAFDMRSW
ncbi:hypothetical protein Hanom_Chr04g00349911 [Helianthus anomalus]